MFSFELLAYRELVNPRAMPDSTNPAEKLPDYFTTADDVTPKRARGHPGRLAAVGRFLDLQDRERADATTTTRSSRTSTCTRYEQGLKGCTTFRFNPEAFQGVLVKEEDLKNTTYVFTLEDGTEVEGEGRRGDRVRRREAHRRESLRRA